MDLVMHKRISTEMREVCAVFGDGMYLFATSYERMPWLLSEIAVLQKAKVLPMETAREIVALSDVKALYDGAVAVGEEEDEETRAVRRRLEDAFEGCGGSECE